MQICENLRGRDKVLQRTYTFLLYVLIEEAEMKISHDNCHRDPDPNCSPYEGICSAQFAARFVNISCPIIVIQAVLACEAFLQAALRRGDLLRSKNRSGLTHKQGCCTRHSDGHAYLEHCRVPA